MEKERKRTRAYFMISVPSDKVHDTGRSMQILFPKNNDALHDKIRYFFKSYRIWHSIQALFTDTFPEKLSCLTRKSVPVGTFSRRHKKIPENRTGSPG
jgi:hypothetical protein